MSTFGDMHDRNFLWQLAVAHDASLLHDILSELNVPPIHWHRAFSHSAYPLLNVACAVVLAHAVLGSVDSTLGSMEHTFVRGPVLPEPDPGLTSEQGGEAAEQYEPITVELHRAWPEGQPHALIVSDMEH